MGRLRGPAVALSLVACGPIVDGDVDDGGATSGSSDASSSSGSSGPSTSATPDPGSGPTSAPDPDGGETSTGSAPAMCRGGDGARPSGTPCSENDHCESGLCLEFSDAPPDVDAVCVEPTSDCATRFTGTAWSLPPDDEPTTGLQIEIHGLTEVMADPAGAVALVQTEAGQPGEDRGRFDTFSMGPLAARSDALANDSTIDP